MSPYSSLPGRAFWRPAIADRHYTRFDDVATGPYFRAEDRIATAGSCFAQHIGCRLRDRGLGFMDLEPAPEGFGPAEARRHGFGLFSCRYGNIYTVRQLLQLTHEAFGLRRPVDAIWSKDGRSYDALRPGVDPVGHASPDDVLLLRKHHLDKVRQLMTEMTLFVFTFGLTEAWESTEDGTIYPTAAGTIAGTFDQSKYRFRNFCYPELRDDFEEFWAFVKTINPDVRGILTVSPVPLTATASGEHVLVATTYSKATLRAVAGDLATAHDEITYFPSYELIATHPMRGLFFNPDMRTVSEAGVEYVMSHFFRDAAKPDVPPRGTTNGKPAESDEAGLDLLCDEGLLDQFAKTN
ncbi:MAG TPA: GSCFA domain-containing protein [Thermomicrobiales bacterium]|jgi:hypothetical protein